VGGGKGWFLVFVGFFEGVLEKRVFFAWCFCGEVVVIAWWIVVCGWSFARGRKFSIFLKYFCGNLAGCQAVA
jgi:hypothetical protein